MCLFLIIFFLFFLFLIASSPSHTQLYFSLALGDVLKSLYGIHKYCLTLLGQKR